MGSPGLARAIQAACDAGALVVIAAGNSGTNNDVIPTIPACYRKDRTERIITVMATDRYDEKASFSNYGIRTVDLAAPGVGLVATRAALRGASAVRDRLTRPFTGPRPPPQRSRARPRWPVPVSPVIRTGGNRWVVASRRAVPGPSREGSSSLLMEPVC
jgi:hypothetical protein